jgi:phosphoglycolate phosphatase
VKYRAALFDLDGTLLDTIQDLADSTNAVLRRMGYPGHAVDAYNHFVGDGVVEMATKALPPGVSEDIVHECVTGMREQYWKHWDRKTRPYPGIPGMLDSLTERNVRMAVLSNKPDNFTVVMVEALLRDWDFEIVQGARPEFPLKPDPAAVLDIARRMGVPAGQFLYLGDTSTDMLTARAAGMSAVGVSWGFRTEKELRESGADFIVSHPLEVLDLL